ncbi:MAG: hypothetical protein WCG04_03115 [Alphaproteobacteria bacterium]
METLSPRYFLGVRNAAWLEMGLSLGVLLAASYIFSDGDRFISAAPHPFWIVVLLITSQYGLAAGILSAALSTSVLFVGNIPEQLVSETHLQYMMRFGYQPALWFFVSIVLGTLRNFHLTEEEALRKKVNTLQKQTELLAESYKKVQGAKKSLILRLASYTDIQEKIYKGVRYLNGLDMEQVSKGLAHLMEESLKATKFSLYLYNTTNDRFELYRSFGWRKDESFVLNIPLVSPLGQALTQSAILCVTGEKDAAVLESEGLLVGTLIDPSTSKFLGLIKVEETAFLSLHPKNIESFKDICSLAGQAIAHLKKPSSPRRAIKKEVP